MIIKYDTEKEMDCKLCPVKIGCVKHNKCSYKDEEEIFYCPFAVLRIYIRGQE